MSASTTLGGKNFTYTSKSVNFFGHEATFIGKNWAVNWIFGGVFMEVAPEYDLPNNIQLCIDNDVAAGNGDKIAMLLVDPIRGAILFLLGKITPEHLKNAQEHDGYIDIPNVEICGRNLTVRVCEELEYDFATADANGVVV